MTPEEVREYGRRGGIASGEAKRRKKAIRETLDVLLAMPIKSGKAADVESIKSFAAVKGKNINIQEAIIISMIQKALKGDVRAAEWVRDTAGQKPAINMNTILESQAIIDHLDDMMQALDDANQIQ